MKNGSIKVTVQSINDILGVPIEGVSLDVNECVDQPDVILNE